MSHIHVGYWMLLKVNSVLEMEQRLEMVYLTTGQRQSRQFRSNSNTLEENDKIDVFLCN